MAEGLILPEDNQILLLTADGLQLANYPMCPTQRERPQTDQLPRMYSLSLFWLTFILKIQRSTFKTGSAVECISAQADLSFGYKAKD